MSGVAGDGNWLRAGRRRSVLGPRQQRRVLGDQRRRRLDPQLVAEQSAEVVEQPQRFDGPAGGRQRRHQQLTRPFPQRVRLRQHHELGHQPIEVAGRQAGRRHDLTCSLTELLQPRRFDPRFVQLVQLGVRHAVPGGEHLAQLPVCHARFCTEQLHQSIGVDTHACRVEPVTRTDRLDQTIWQPAPQPQHVVLQSRRWVVRQRVGPQHLGSCVWRDHETPAQDQQRQQAQLQHARRCHIAPGRVANAQRAEHLDAHTIPGHPRILDRDQPMRHRSCPHVDSALPTRRSGEVAANGGSSAVRRSAAAPHAGLAASDVAVGRALVALGLAMQVSARAAR